jgi:ABC-type sulfate/molybdate transport systems ATPase subunit
MSVPILECENLQYREDNCCLFNEVSFRLDSGQRGVILAEPHRSATALLKICATLMAPTGGQIRWFGRAIEEMAEHEIYNLRRRIGLVHRETSLISNLTILDNISLGLQYHNEIAREEAYDQATELLKKFELYEDRFSRPAQLTFEQRRMAVYARELIKQPTLFLLEHPSLDLGERVYSLLLDAFQTSRGENGCSFLVSSIKAEVANRWGDWVLVLDEGKSENFSGTQFDPSAYRATMRRRGLNSSGERRDE